MRRRRRDERGAAAVEAALVTPLMIMLIFGMIEFSLVLRDNAVVSSNTRIGARIAATGAAAGPGTCDAVGCVPSNVPALAQAAADAIQRSGAALPANSIDYLVVYKANDAGFPGSASAINWQTKANADQACSGVPACVVFKWNATQKRFRYSSGSWVSSTISACFPGSATAPLDRVGVGLQASHEMVTKLFGSSMTLRDRAVQNFEPLPPATCGALRHQ